MILFLTIRGSVGIFAFTVPETYYLWFPSQVRYHKLHLKTNHELERVENNKREVL
jgi:hypothetical protein